MLCFAPLFGVMLDVCSDHDGSYCFCNSQPQIDNCAMKHVQALQNLQASAPGHQPQAASVITEQERISMLLVSSILMYTNGAGGQECLVQIAQRLV